MAEINPTICISTRHKPTLYPVSIQQHCGAFETSCSDSTSYIYKNTIFREALSKESAWPVQEPFDFYRNVEWDDSALLPNGSLASRIVSFPQYSRRRRRFGLCKLVPLSCRMNTSFTATHNQSADVTAPQPSSSAPLPLYKGIREERKGGRYLDSTFDRRCPLLYIQSDSRFRWFLAYKRIALYLFQSVQVISTNP